MPTAFGKDGAEGWVRTQVDAERSLFRGESKNPRIPVETLSDRQVRPEREGSGRTVFSEADLRNFRAQQRAAFSRSEDTAATSSLTSTAQTRAAVRQVLDGWKGDKPVVHVVGSIAETRMRGASELPATDPGRVEGFLSNGHPSARRRSTAPCWPNLPVKRVSPTLGRPFATRKTGRTTPCSACRSAKP